MEDFNEYQYNSSKEANTAISDRIEQMQQLYKEIVLIARAYDLKVSAELSAPEYVTMGHNQEPYVYWNASSAYC